MPRAVRDGSLVVTLELDVAEPGAHTVYANLFGDGGARPGATTKRTFRLDAGRRSVELVFFGKAVFESGPDGPYLLKDLHGLRQQEGDEADLWWGDPRAFATGAYAVTDFSPADWASAERRGKLAHFEPMLTDLAREP